MKDNIKRFTPLVTTIVVIGLLSGCATKAEVQLLRERVAALEANSVLSLNGHLVLDSSGTYPTARFNKVNVQIVNGQGNTNTVNGVGNLIVGYNAERPSGVRSEECSSGEHTSQSDCEGAGQTWALNHKSGSHNIVVGDQHNYSSFAGTVLGFQNTSNRDAASVVGGYQNSARGKYSSVAGGQLNRASGFSSSTCGGLSNLASGINASVSGGFANKATGQSSSVSGWNGNEANEHTAAVSGGVGNKANALNSSVSGGVQNTASGTDASVSGGANNNAGGTAGSVSGGRNRSTSGDFDWVAGSLLEDI